MYEAPPARTRLSTDDTFAMRKALEAGALRLAGGPHEGFALRWAQGAVMTAIVTTRRDEDHCARDVTFTAAWLADHVVRLPVPLELLEAHLDRIGMQLETPDDVLALAFAFYRVFGSVPIRTEAELADATDDDDDALAGDIAGVPLSQDLARRWRAPGFDGDDAIFFANFSYEESRPYNGFYEVRVNLDSFQARLHRLGAAYSPPLDVIG